MGAIAGAWKLDRPHVASLKLGPVEGFAECKPDGIAFVLAQWNSQRVDSIAVLCSRGPAVASELKLAELYVRGTDLVADFLPAGPQRIAPQVYWRSSLEANGTAIRIELLLSVRTELLDSMPSWRFETFVRDAVLLHASSLDSRAFEDISRQGGIFERSDSAEHLLVFRHERLGLSYAEMVHPTDFASADATLDGNQPLSVVSQLFSERLEKGVIRRGRICGWFMPAENDLETAVALAKQFVDEPLPLTT